MDDDKVKLETLKLSDYCTSLRDVGRGHDAEVLLLTCIDFRFFDEVAKHMENAGLTGKYDHIIVAGAELGPVVDFPPDPRLHWQQFFLEHLALSKALHNIQRVVVLGHQDCGAYRKFRVLPEKPTLEQERAAHRAQAERLRALVHRFNPELEMEAFLLAPSEGAEVPLTLHRLV